MLPPPRRSTLFPYTTLFRSGSAGRCPFHKYSDAGRPLAVPPRPPPRQQLCGRLVGVQRSALQPQLLQEPPCLADFGSDRKSTRLNSSHSSISYAVFCLKKKK